MKRHEILPKAVPLPEIIRQEEEWKAPPPLNSDHINTWLTAGSYSIIPLFVFLFILLLETATIVSIILLVLLLVYFAAVNIYSLRIGRKVSAYNFGVLLLAAAGSVQMSVLMLEAVGHITIEEEVAIRPAWLAIQCILCVPAFILMVVQPLVVLIAIFARRMRCTREVRSEFKGCGYAGINAYEAGLSDFVGAAHYHYEADGAVYVAVYREHTTVTYPRGSDNYIRIDPDYPEYYYDPDTARELRRLCFPRFFVSLGLFAVFALNIAIFGFNAFAF